MPTAPPALPPERRALTAARWLATLLVLALAALGANRVWEEGGRVPTHRAADALPVYLAAAAVLDGEDPTTQAGLQRAYERRELTVRAATFSNLYPASAGVLVAPLARGSWEEFLGWWRGLLLLGGLLGGACGGLAAVRGRNAPLAAAIGAWIAVTAFPVTGECVALGQANLLVGGLLGLSMAALRWRRPGVAAAAATLGGGLKLVPGIVGWTLLSGRRWRGLAAVAGCVALLAAATLPFVPLDRVVAGVIGTLRFQGAISPGWITNPEVAGWVRFLGDLRHTPAMVATLALMGVTAWAAAGALREQPERGWTTLAGTVALATAWLGADASGFHVLYAPLFIPAVAWVATWPLDRGAPRIALAAPLVAAAPALLLSADLPGVPDEARLVAAGLLTWAAVAGRLLWTSPALPMGSVGVVAAAGGWGVASVVALGDGPRGPDPALVPGGDVSGLGLPEGVGHGGPQPGGGVLQGQPDGQLDPTQADALPGAPPVAGTGSSGALLEELLPPEQASRLTSHLVQSPRRWSGLDHPVAAWLADSAPPPPASLVAVGPLVRWMAWERLALDRIDGTGPHRAQWDRTWAVLGQAPER